jgi:hypothetical protein
MHRSLCGFWGRNKSKFILLILFLEKMLYGEPDIGIIIIHVPLHPQQAKAYRYSNMSIYNIAIHWGSIHD